MKNYAVLAPRKRDFWNWVNRNLGIYARTNFTNASVETAIARYFYVHAASGSERLGGISNIEIILAGNYEEKPPKNLEEFNLIARISKR